MKVELLKSQNIELSKLEVNKGQIEGLPKNPRLIKDAKFEKLKKSIEDNPEMLGMREVLVFPHGSKYVIIGGNMRFQACKELQFLTVPCKILDKDTTAEQLRAITIKDNVGFGEHDWELLANEWDSVELEEWGLEVPNFETEETILEAEEDDYEEPENLKVDVVLGDLIEFECTDGRVHRLICGDSTDSDAVAKLMNGSKADLVFTSPPYNGNTTMYEATGSFNKKDKVRADKTLYLDNQTDNKSDEEYIQFNSDIFNTIKTIAADDLVILYNINYNRNSPDLFIDVVNKARESFSLVETIIWEKSMAISLAGDNLTRIIEFIFVFYNGNDKPKLNKTHTNECIKNLWSISNIGANHETHKACFPIKLVEQGINVYAKENALLYEPFTGSGTTMVAAHQLKRKCYGMELEPKYCQVIIDRMQKLDSTIKVKINSKEYANT